MGRRSCGRRAVAFGVVLLFVGATASASGGARHGWSALAPTIPVPTKTRSPVEFDQHTALVRFRPGVGEVERAAVVEAQAGRLGPAVPGTAFSLVRLEGNPLQFVSRLRADPRVAQIVPNFIRRIDEDPNDAAYWLRQATLDAVRLPLAWSTTHGSIATKIAIIDTGVDLDHPDLAPRILPGKDFVNDDDSADDDNSHGTMVAGLAAASANNGFGVAGAAWNGSIIPVKVLGATGSGTDADVAAGITWATDQGAKVVNLSLGGPADSPVLRQAVDYALAHDVLVVAAAGNNGSSLEHYPAAYPGVIAVASTNDVGESSSFSNHAPWVDIAAPGEDALSTAPASLGIDQYANGWGTSFASPIVAGIAALVRTVNPTWTQAQVASRLYSTARDLGPPGIDDSYGHGLLDAAAALGAARQTALPPPRDALEPNGTLDEAKAIGSGVSATISPENDVDWYYVDVATAGVWLTFTVTPPSDPSDTSFDGVLQAESPALTLLGTRDASGGGSGETLVVPANTVGRYYLRVSNYEGSRTTRAVSSRSDFIDPNYSVSVSQGSAPPGRFAPAEVYAKGLTDQNGEMNTWPQWVAIGDLNGDGRNDVVLTTGAYVDPEHDNKVYVYPQLADSSLGDPSLLDPGCRGPTAEIGDLNGDGKGDLAVACGESGMKIYYQSGGQLGPPTTLANPTATLFQIADVNRDGRNDLVTQGYDGIVVATNTGSGFTTRPVGSARGRVRVGDMTGDGRPDVVVFNPNPPTVYVFAQNADGSFAAPATYDVPSNGRTGSGLEVADLTADGRADVAVTIDANYPNSRVIVYPQTATGTLGSPVIYTVLDIPQPLAAGDFDHDGRNDLATAHGGFTSAGLMLQNASGGLQPEETYPITFADDYPNIAAGDVNADGDLDIAIPDYNYGLVILRQYSRNLPPGEQLWVRVTSPSDFAAGVTTGVAPTIRFARALDGASVTAATVTLQNGDTGAAVAATIAYDGATRTITVRPSAALAAAPYLLTVSDVRDSAGNVMPTPFSFRFTTVSATDVYPPETQIWSGSSGTMSSSGLGFSFVSEEKTATFSCSLNGSAFTACISPAIYSVSPGTYNFQVRARDAAGNIDATPARKRVVIVAVGQNPPDTWFAYSWPHGTVASPTATFELGTDTGIGFECSLDGAPYTACSTPKTYSGITPGVHTFSARAIANGMVDPLPLAVAWTVASSPTAVTVRALTVRRTPRGALVRWTTGAEIGLLGFDVYRSEHGRRTRVNRALVPSTGAAHAYALLDRTVPRRTSLRYWLRVTRQSGVRYWCGPTIARAPTPRS